MKISMFVRSLIIAAIVSTLSVGAGICQWGNNEPAKTAEAVAAEKAAKERTDAQEVMKKLVKAAKEKLNGTAWEIDLKGNTSAADVKGKKLSSSAMEKDRLNFTDNKIESSSMSSNGFKPTNYTVRLKGKKNEIVIWETMQTSADKGVAFWRGEIEDDVMRGVLSWQIDEKNKQDYSFTSSKKDVATPRAAPTAAPAPVAAPSPTAAPVPAAIQPPQIDKIANKAVASMAVKAPVVEEKKAVVVEKAAPVVVEEKIDTKETNVKEAPAPKPVAATPKKVETKTEAKTTTANKNNFAAKK